MFDFKTVITGKPIWVKDPDQDIPVYEYTTYPRRFMSFRWFKPLLTSLLAFAFWMIFAVILVSFVTGFSSNPDFLDSIVSESYDNMDTYTAAGGLINFGILAVSIPAVALALLITRERPFSSLSSSCGGWRWNVFFKCLGIAAVLYAIQTPIQLFLLPDSIAPGVILFDLVGFIVCVVLVPFQCVAEEYLFRGVLMQTLGAWFRFPIIALVGQAVLFMLGHPYNALGMFAILLNGIAFGLVAMISRGLESSSAYHVVNNMTAFLMVGFGLGIATSEITVVEVAIAIISDIAYIALIVLADRKWNWFKAKGDGTIKSNEKKIVSMTPDKIEKAIQRGAVLPPSYAGYVQQFPPRTDTMTEHK